MQGVHKRFGAVQALGGVDLSVEPAEVHALVGENGAGKSTLMKILSGALQADRGQLRLLGQPYAPDGPQQARDRGVAMIYQELSLAPDLSVAQNIALGREPRRHGFVDRVTQRRQAQSALQQLGATDLSPDRKVSELGPGQRQMVEIARALRDAARIVVMDEPTSSLSSDETQRLFQVIERLRQGGVAVIYISHFLEEIERIADRYTVLRDGRSVDAGPIAGTPMSHLVEQMAGRAVSEVFPRVAHDAGEPVLHIKGLRGHAFAHGIELTLRRGEILGIAGLIGAGRTELLRALFGLDPVRRGEIRVGTTADRGAPPWRRISQGLGLLSEDRKQEGLALSMSIADNLTLTGLRSCARLGWVQRERQSAQAGALVERLRVRCPDVHAPVESLSGGNQQKVALGRLLHQDADVLLLDEPTRGVDVASKVEIYRLMGELAAAGKAVLFVSSYVPELVGVCDRLAVMHRGQLGEPPPSPNGLRGPCCPQRPRA